MYDMIDSILINKSALVAISLETDLLSPDQIPNENEFVILKEFCSILEPLKDLTVYLSASSYTTSCILYPAIYNLIYIFLPQLTLYNRYMNILRDEFKIILRKRFHYLFDGNSNSVYLAATYLDPNFKSMSFIEDDGERETNRDRARKFIASVSSRLVCLDREKEVERTASIHSTPQSSEQSSSVVSIGSSSSSSSSASSASSASLASSSSQ